MTLIKELMDWVEKEMIFYNHPKYHREWVILEDVKYKIKELAKKDLVKLEVDLSTVGHKYKKDLEELVKEE